MTAFFGAVTAILSQQTAPVGGGGPSVGDGLLFEAGTDFLLLETGDYLLLEA